MRLRLSAILAILAAAATAQTPNASILGRVTDPTGAVIPEASVVIRNVDTTWTRQIATQGNGEYAVTQLGPGQYEVMVQKDGFRKVTRTGIKLQIDQVARIDVQMQVGSLVDTISVVAEAPIINSETEPRAMSSSRRKSLRCLCPAATTPTLRS